METVRGLDGWALVLALARVAPAVVIGPLATGLAVPRTALAALALAVAVVVAAGDGAGAALLAGAGWAARLAVLAREAGIGAVLGVVAAVPLAAAGVAGRWVAVLASDEAEGSWSAGLGLIGALVFFALGGHLAVVSALGVSYRALPVTGGGSLGVAEVIGAGAAMLAAALAMAAPLVVAAVVAALVVGAVERAVGLPGALVPELALRRLVLVLGLAAALLGIGLAVAGQTRALPDALARLLGG